MNHKIFTLLALLIAAIATSSCLGNDDDNDTVTYDDTAVTAFSLGTLKQLRDTVGKSGKDSTYYATIQGSKYAFLIDQSAGTIYNSDSLPYGTKVKAVLAGISTKNSGVVTLKSLTDDTYTVYYSTDSIDFSQPRTMRVYASSGQSYRTYTVKVNVHRQQGNKFTWTQLADNSNFAGLTGTRAISLGDNVYLFGNNGTQTKGYVTASNNGKSWTALGQTFANDAYKNFIANSSTLFTLSNGSVMRTSNGSSWSAETPNVSLKQLIAATDKQLYALAANGKPVVSKDNGKTWSNETLSSGSNAASLPANNISAVRMAANVGESVFRLLLVGTPTGSNTVAIWTKLVSDNNTYAWSYIDPASTRYALPTYQNLTVLPYDGKAIALGQKSGNTIAPILLTSDGGITWKQNSSYTVPTTTATAGSFAATVDKNNYLWVISGNKVWKGILNRLGWTAK